MGQIRRAKDGHYYSVRRTRSGRYYTIQHGDGTGTDGAQAALLGMLIFAPFTFGLSLLVATPIAFVLVGKWLTTNLSRYLQQRRERSGGNPRRLHP